MCVLQYVDVGYTCMCTMVHMLYTHLHTHTTNQDGDDQEEKLEDKFTEMVNHYAEAYQLLLRQIILNWKVLSPAIKSRALLVGGQHMLLLPQMDDNWAAYVGGGVVCMVEYLRWLGVYAGGGGGD